MVVRSRCSMGAGRRSGGPGADVATGSGGECSRCRCRRSPGIRGGHGVWRRLTGTSPRRTSCTLSGGGRPRTSNESGGIHPGPIVCSAHSQARSSPRAISRYGVKTDIDDPAQSVGRLAWRNPTFPAQEARAACDVGLRCANPTYNPASVKCPCLSPAPACFRRVDVRGHNQALPLAYGPPPCSTCPRSTACASSRPPPGTRASCWRAGSPA